MEASEDLYLVHYGTKRHSGRYPWGSGDPKYRKSVDFTDRLWEMRRSGMSESEIAKAMGMTTTELRARKSDANNIQKEYDIAKVRLMKDAQMSDAAIAREGHLSETTVRNYQRPDIANKRDKATEVADLLKDYSKDHPYIDYGAGVELMLGASTTQMNTAIQKLKDEGYSTKIVRIKQANDSNQYTNVRVLIHPDKEPNSVFGNLDKIRAPGVTVDDLGHVKFGIGKPQSIDSKRIKIRYSEDGGGDMDGVIQIRKGCKDLDLGNAHYAQVRIAVDGTHYLKGMAMYSDDIPKGKDIVFNTSKSKKLPMTEVLKPLKVNKETGKVDEENPFGAIVTPKHFVDSSGKKKKSALYIVNEEGDWDNWSRNLSAQFLSKQRVSLAKTQLKKKQKQMEDQYDKIMSITNPALRKHMLESFADDCDSSAAHLKAAKFPRQSTHVILPLPKIKPNEVYARNFRQGEKVVLIRYPHGGIFEIPELTVNNRSKTGRSLIGETKDAIGIHPKVAQKLSGADFDGDTVVVIPVGNKSQIRTAPTLAGLKGFEPKRAYPQRPGMKLMTKRGTQTEMGKISNLITDMTIKGAKPGELAMAVRHSMVVIDAHKHKLDYKQSEKDNRIADLKAKYQGGPKAGSSTLISRAGSTEHISKRRLRRAAEGGRVDPKTGRKVYIDTPEFYINNKGKKVERTIEVKRMHLVDDAYKLSSGTKMESVYADHANSMKRLGEKARLQALHTAPIKLNPSARKEYAPEIQSLRAKLNRAIKQNAVERQAQVVANGVIKAKRQANPDMTSEESKKLRTIAINHARARLYKGEKRYRIVPTEREWEAIQSGAVSHHMVEQIIQHGDKNKIQAMALPKPKENLSANTVSRVKAMRAKGKTASEIADVLGLSTDTVKEV